MKELKTKFTTKQLKLILENEKTLTFVLPGKEFDNWIKKSELYQYRSYDPRPKKDKTYPLDLTVCVVYSSEPLTDPKVFINGIPHRSLKLDSPLYKAWFKSSKTANNLFNLFVQDFRYLMRLNSPEVDPNLNILWEYLKSNSRLNVYSPIGENGLGIYQKKKRGHPIHPKRPKKKQNHILVKHPEPLKCVKDLVTKEVARLPLSEALEFIKGKDYIKFCSKKEWRWYINSLNPKIKILRDKDEYWEQDTKEESGGENSKIYIPKKPTIHGKINFVFKNGVLSTTSDKPYKPRKYPLYDRNKHWQTIVKPPVLDDDKLVYIQDKKDPNKQVIDLKSSPIKEEKYITSVLIPIYEYVPVMFKGEELLDKNGDKVVKKKLVKVEREDVTFMRPSRTTYKTIVTTQYPGELSYKRHIIKENYERLKKQREEEEKLKKEQETKQEETAEQKSE